MRSARWMILGMLSTLALAGCLGGGSTQDDGADDLQGPLQTVDAAYEVFTLPAVYQDPIGLYEPTIDVSDDGTVYVSAHSTEVGRNPAPAYFSLDDGATWESMALFMDVQGEPEEQMSAPLLSDEVFIIAADDDPMVPGSLFREAAVRDNRAITVRLERHGGHCGFFSAASDGQDPYWAEATAIDFLASHL